MITRKTAVKFNIVGGIDSLSNTLKSLILANGEYAEHSISYPDNPNYVLWVKKDKLDVLCSNSEFWQALVNNRIVSFDMFMIRVYCDESLMEFSSNDNTQFGRYINSTIDITQSTQYLSNSKYEDCFIMPIDEDMEDYI